MAFFASNELTGGHGVSPVDKPKVAIEKFTRAFLIYVKLGADPAKADQQALRIRQFYHDYKDLGLDTPDKLIAAAVNLGRKSHADVDGDLPPDLQQVPGFGNRDVKIPAQKRAPFPYIFAKGFDEVNFGWTPCHVIFVFDNADFQFVRPDDPGSYNQPVVFRKNKAIQDEKGNWIAGGPYEENHSFFNLTADYQDGYSYLIMENHMKVGSDQRPIEKPATGNPDDWPVWRYCMDINVRIPQNRLTTFLAEAETLSSGTQTGTTSWLTVVFDPPQNNGNGGGPG